MAEESFMLVSLRESKAKKLAQVIGNETCRKILDSLSKGEATETQLSKSLNVPLSTIHYNLQHLVENKLVVAEQFHYSEKGKEVLHYKLANKLIIIAPQDADPGLLEKLKDLMPVGIITIAATVALSLFTGQYTNVNTFSKSAQADISEGAMYATETISSAAQANALPEPSFFTGIAIWFLIGGLFSLAVYFSIEMLKFHKKRK